MDVKTIAAQVLLTAVSGSDGLSEKTKDLLNEIPAGGVVLFKYNLGRGGKAALRLSREATVSVVRGGIASGSPGLPPFVAVDHEGGGVHRFGSDLTRLPAAAAFSLSAAPAEESVRGAALRAGRELRAVGVSLNLAPVAEAGEEGSSALFLGDRAYCADADATGKLAAAFVAGMDEAGTACALKHFPGNAAADPHRALPTLLQGKHALDAMASPFAGVFRSADPAAVMVSHAVVASMDPEVPGSLSRAVVTDWLRNKMGFRGMVVTDDLRMAAISSTGRTPAQAAVEAVAAGADLVMTWPEDLRSLRDALVVATGDGRLPRGRLEDAARRVVAAKLRYGLLPMDQAGLAFFEADTGGFDSIEDELAGLRTETERYLNERGL